MSQTDGFRSVRPPAVAGQFYPGQADALRETLAACFTSPLGPGTVPPLGDGPRRVFGLVVPHAGYVYSGPAAAYAYAEAARDGIPSAVILLGVNHRGLGAPLAVSPASGWQTPLGIAPVERGLAEELLALDADAAYDAVAHAHEHSLEVQVPFLQFLFGEIPLLPILLGAVSPQRAVRLGEALAQLGRGRNLLMVASTDFSHYIPQEVAERNDRLALEQIADVHPLDLMKVVRDHGITMCGVLPTAALLAAAEESGVEAAKILHYHTSGEVSGDRREVVGYGAAALYR